MITHLLVSTPPPEDDECSTSWQLQEYFTNEFDYVIIAKRLE